MVIETVRQYFEERVPTIIEERSDDVSRARTLNSSRI